MAINDTDNQQTAAPQAAHSTAGQPAAQPQSQRQAGWSFHSSSLFGAPIRPDPYSDYMKKMLKGLEEIYKSADPSCEISLILLDPSVENALIFSAIVVCLKIKDQPKLGVAYHVLICEATHDPLPPLIENINGQQVEIMRVTSDALDIVLANKVKERVTRAYPGLATHMVDACVVPRTFNPEDDRAMQQLALNAGVAAKTELQMRVPTWSDFNLSLNQRDSNLVVTQTFQNQQIEDAVGCPMRSDVLISFSSQKQRDQNQQAGIINNGDRETKVSEVSGFIDLVWRPLAPTVPQNYYAPQQLAAPTQKYAARLVLTNISSNFAYTPSSILLSVATAMTLRDNNNWYQVFRPTNTGKEIDLRDLGAINIEANTANEPTPYGTRINTKADTFRLEDMGRLINMLVQPGMAVSIDCPENGAQSWYLSPFAAANCGNQTAYNVLFEAAQELTGGQFGKYFQKGEPMFVDAGNRIHLGTWTDANGIKRDIRDIDTLAVANLIGERDPHVIREWSDTFLRLDYPLAQRLAARKKIISGLTNHSATFTGFAQRVTFSTSFLMAISLGIRDLQIPVRINTPLSAASFNDARGVASWVDQGILAPGATFQQAASVWAQPQFAQGFQNQYRWY